MSELLLPAAVLAAVLALTYLFCYRPMRSGACRNASVASTQSAGDVDLERGLQQARNELHRLRAE